MLVCFQKQNCQSFHISTSYWFMWLTYIFSNILMLSWTIENSSWFGFRSLHDEIPNGDSDVSCKKTWNFEEASGDHLCNKLKIYGQISVIFLLFNDQIWGLILNIQKIKSDNIQQLQCSVCDLHCEIILKGHILEKYIICPILQALKLYCCGITIFNYIKPIICVSHLIVIHPFCSSREFREKLIKVAWLEKVTEKSLDFFIFLPWNLFPVCAKGIIFIVCLIFSLI